MRYELAALALCVACGGQAWNYQRLTRDPSKGDLVSVTCEDSQSQCYYAARYACSGDFTVESADGGRQTKGAVVTGNAVIVASKFTGSMLVRCSPVAAQQKTASQ